MHCVCITASNVGTCYLTTLMAPQVEALHRLQLLCALMCWHTSHHGSCASCRLAVMLPTVCWAFQLVASGWCSIPRTTSLPRLLSCACRAGLDPDTEKLLREFDQVVYISCNPETLAKNLAAVSDTHEIKRFAVFDQVSTRYM